MLLPSSISVESIMELEHKYGMDAKIEHKYFDLVREEFVDGKKRTIRRCKICQRDYKGTASVNSNFITHLKHVHPELLHDWARKKAERAEKATSFLSRHQGTSMLPAYGRNYLSSISTAQIPKCEYTPIKEGLAPTTLASLTNMGQSDADRQVAIMRSVLNYLVMDIQPASVINRKGFRNLMRAMHPYFGLPTASQIRDTLIPSAYEHVKDSIISQLSLVPVVNLQISVISNCFVAVTAYYLSVYWELKHHLLAVHVISPGMEWESLVEQTKTMYGISSKIYYEKVNKLSLEDFTKTSKLSSAGRADNEATSSESNESETSETDSSFAYVITKIIHQALGNPKLTRLLDERCGAVNHQPQDGLLFTPYWLQVLAKLRVFINNNKDVVSIKSEPQGTTSPQTPSSVSSTTTLSPLGVTRPGISTTATTTTTTTSSCSETTSPPSSLLTSLSNGLAHGLLAATTTRFATATPSTGAHTPLSTALNVSLAGLNTNLNLNGLTTSLNSGLTGFPNLKTSLSDLHTGLNAGLNGLNAALNGLNSTLDGSPDGKIATPRVGLIKDATVAPFSAHNITILQDLGLAVELVDILEPFEEVYNLISSDTTPSVGIIVPSILSLEQLLRDIKSIHLSDLVVSLNTALQKHLTPLLRQKYYQEAAALDPRFKMRWCRGSQEESNVQTRLEELAQELRISNPSPPATFYKADENVSDAKVNEQATKRRKLFSFLEKSEDKDVKPSSALLLEFNDFVREQLLLDYECPFRYWQEKCGTYRCLAQLSYYLCSIPACPPPVDKVFLEWTVSVNSFQQCNSLQELERLFFLNVNSSLW